MTTMSDTARSTDWVCANCGKPLAPGKTSLTYMGSRFTVELLQCPSCGLVFIPEDLALGKMAEVERILEDK